MPFRASRQTELPGSFPLHVVTEWLGNTPQIALKHYLRVTDEDFAQACGEGEIVRLLTSLCQRSKWRGQDSNEVRAPRETVTSSPPALQKAVHLMQPITS